MNKYYIFDFDSTFVKCEALDELAGIALRERVDRAKVVDEIKRITNLGMEGRITFSESLDSRFKLLAASKKHIGELVERLKQSITDSIAAQQNFFLENSERIYIITGGFRDYVLPVVSAFGILPQHVLANEFIYENDNIVGYDKDNFLSRSGGKAEVVRNLKLPGEVIVIGDGYSDYEIKAAGVADHFYAFTENVRRESVVNKADRVLASLDEMLFDNTIIT